MFLAVFLFDRIEVEVLAGDVHMLARHGHAYQEIGREWEQSLFLGFYDWLRTAADEVIGINLILHDGREVLRDIIPDREYVVWLAPSVVRISILPGEVDEAASADQEFSASRCLQATDGSVALIFDAEELTSAQLELLSERSARRRERDMGTSKEGRDFINGVKAAVRRTCAAMRAARSSESLAGYALATDDDLATLSHFAITKESLASSKDPDLLFVPTDWPEAPEPQSFDKLDRQLRARATATADFHAHVDDSFRLLVDALAEAKQEGVFQDGVFLSVLSTDPGPHLEELENFSVRRLNTATLVQDRDAFLARWQ
jgi:hypothetical protein